MSGERIGLDEPRVRAASTANDVVPQRRQMGCGWLAQQRAVERKKRGRGARARSLVHGCGRSRVLRGVVQVTRKGDRSKTGRQRRMIHGRVIAIDRLAEQNGAVAEGAVFFAVPATGKMRVVSARTGIIGAARSDGFPPRRSARHQRQQAARRRAGGAHQEHGQRNRERAEESSGTDHDVILSAPAAPGQTRTRSAYRGCARATRYEFLRSMRIGRRSVASRGAERPLRFVLPAPAIHRP